MPAALVALLSATAALGVAWTLALPPLQAPDEPAHLAYVQSLAERGLLPGDRGRPSQSTEQRLASGAASSAATARDPSAKPSWSEAAHERWRRVAERLPDSSRADGGGPSSAASNPPLYYVWGVVPYQLASGGDLFARITAARLSSLLFLLVAVVATWLLAGVAFGPRRDVQLAAAAVPALLPMFTSVTASVSPNSLSYALWTLALWLGARILRGRDGLPDHVALLGVTGTALTTTATSYALLPAVLFVWALSLWRLRRRHERIAAILVAGVAALALTAGVWFAVAGAGGRPAAEGLTEALDPPDDLDVLELGSYAWQYYLPRLPFQTAYGGAGWPPPAYEVWIKGTLGGFGSDQVQLPERAYVALGLVALAVALTAVVGLVRRRARVELPLLAFLALAAIGLLAGLHWNEYRLAGAEGMLVNQGRHLFPLVGLAGLTAGAALATLRRPLRATALGAFVGGLGALQLYSIGHVAARFYA